MPFKGPTVPELVDRIQADLEFRLAGTDARIRRSLLRALSRGQVGMPHGRYRYLDWINGFVEHFRGTTLDEFFRPAFRQRLNESVKALMCDFDAQCVHYDTERSTSCALKIRTT